MRSVKDTFIIESAEEQLNKKFWVDYYKGNNKAVSVTGIKSKDIIYNSIELEINGEEQDIVKETLISGICKVLKQNIFMQNMYFAYVESNMQKMYLRYEEDIRFALKNYYEHNYNYENLKETILVSDNEYELSDFIIRWNADEKIGDYELVFSFYRAANGVKLIINYDNQIEEKDISYIIDSYSKEIQKSNCIIEKIDSNRLWSIFIKNYEENKKQIAVFEGKKKVTYEELYKKVCEFEQYIKNNLDQVACIGLVFNRNIEYIISMLAIVKCKKVFVPIDEKIPDERKKYIIDQIGGVLVSNEYKDELKEFTQIILANNMISCYLGNSKNIEISSEARYIIYTSGTTGTPKGVVIGEKSIENLYNWFSKKFFDERINVLAMTSISFDVSIEEILISLMRGCTIHLISDDIKINPKEFLKYIKNNDINMIQFVPDSLRVLAKTTKRIESIKYIICGGEALDLKTRNSVLNLGYRLFNHYGPTETTVDAITCECNLEQNSRIIGKPILNYDVYIIDEKENVLHNGKFGEIVISGAGLALGYLCDSEKTKRSFKYIPSLGKIVYKTGDYGRKTLDGNIEFIGRIDTQIKLRGHRIELSEIENIINKVNGVSRSKVQIENSMLVAYIEVNSRSVLDNNIKEYISKYLPKYMIPQKYLLVKALPTNINGKIDVRSIKNDDYKIKTNIECTDTEKLLLSVLQKKLNITIDNIETTFEEMGVDSYYYITLYYEIKENICDSLEMTDLQKNNTIKKLAKIIEIKGLSIKENIEKKEVVLLKNNNRDESVFFVHPGNGEIHMFLNLTHHMPNKYNYYGIRYIAHHSGPSNISAEQLALNYCNEILKIQNDNFIIIGHCIGGTIAYEMCRQLEEKGKKVKYLGIINSFAPDRKFWGKINDFTAEKELKKLTKIINDKTFEKNLSEEMSIKKLWEEADSYLNLHQDFNADKFIYDGINEIIHDYDIRNAREIADSANVIRTLDRLRANYNPTNKINTSISLYLANQEYASNYEKWKDYTEGSLEIKNVIGTNTSIFKEPNVEVLANEIISGIS